jgi:NAD(P)-dependent dehydrogenase (short-subunit alcohol dehydrogenase family)
MFLMIDPQLKNKVVLITGANHGIGAATALAFVAQGAKVFITYYRSATRYSEEELKPAREAGVGGDVLYRTIQQQSADPRRCHCLSRFCAGALAHRSIALRRRRLAHASVTLFARGG